MELCTCTSSCCSSCTSICGYEKKEKGKKTYACYCVECKKNNDTKKSNTGEFKIVLKNNRKGEEKKKEEKKNRSRSKSKIRKFIVVENESSAGVSGKKEQNDKKHRSKSRRRNDDCEDILLYKPKSLTIIIKKEKLKKNSDAKISKAISDEKVKKEKTRNKSKQKYYLHACDSDSNDSVLFKPRSEKNRAKYKPNDETGESKYLSSKQKNDGCFPKQKAKPERSTSTNDYDDDYFTSTSSSSSTEIGCTRWCRNKNLTNDIRHDRNIEFKYPFKSDPCPKHPVCVEDMRKFKCFLKIKHLRERKDFDIVPGIGEVYNKRLAKRLNNVYELLETAHVMDKTNFKSLLKCYANINCYFGEMVYQSLIEYAKHYRLNF